MGKETTENSKAWSKVYETTDFGNKYPTNGLVSLYFHFMKERLARSSSSNKGIGFCMQPWSECKVFCRLGF